MAYNENIAERVRRALGGLPKVEEKKMMGGLTFMVNGKMCIGILNEDLMCRIDPDVYESSLRRNGCREMDFTGKPMRGFVFVNSDGIKTREDFEYRIAILLVGLDNSKEETCLA